MIREQFHMELNNMSYSKYYLVNRQMDLAYNPPKENPGDSRIVSGIVHEKGQTILSILMDMNFQPHFRPFDMTNKHLVDACEIFTAKVKKSLELDSFKDKLEDIFRMLISQGNAFVVNKKYDKYEVKKIKTSGQYGKITWKTVYEKSYGYCSTELIPNTAIYPMNIQEVDKHKQARMYRVMYYPVGEMAQIYGEFERWKNVPKNPTRTVPVNTNGIWGDYYLQMPQKDYMECIVMESEIYNEYNVWLNGTQMYPVQDENGLITGYPLTEESPSGEYLLSKGDYQRIPFFFFSGSNGKYNEVKEEEINEVMRLMVLMLRQKTQPSVGNMRDTILHSDIWAPNTILENYNAQDISILKPNEGIQQAEFSFYKMLQDSISDSSVSDALEGSGPSDGTATVYIDQKKQALKKIGLSIDRAMDLLKQIYWNVLYNEVSIIDQKVKSYDPNTQKFTEDFMSFKSEGMVDGKKGTINVILKGDTGTINPYEHFGNDLKQDVPTTTYIANPAALQSVIEKMKDQIYLEVLSEPDGQQQSMLSVLMNQITQYINIGGNPRKVNLDYIEQVIADGSGFDPNKVWLDQPIPQPMPPQAPGQSQQPPGQPGVPIPQNLMNNQQNPVLANAS